MKVFNKRSLAIVLVVALTLGLAGVVTTSHRAYAAQAPVDLQTAAPFAILSGTPNITDSPTSVITGNVGMSPAASSAIGLLCTQVTGIIYAIDGTGNPCFTVNAPLVVAAKGDLTAAYIDAAGRTPFSTVPTELGGTTKIPGVYTSGATTFGITAGAGPLVLDGQGDRNAVFIFEAGFSGTGLTVGPGSTVSLINGAQACNVFWKVDTASINTTAVFKGSILALNSISVANGANIEGRLLARNGNVTLINDTITLPVCTAGSTTSTSTSTAVPGLPNTGIAPTPNSVSWKTITPYVAVVAVGSLFYLARKKSTS